MASYENEFPASRAPDSAALSVDYDYENKNLQEIFKQMLEQPGENFIDPSFYYPQSFDEYGIDINALSEIDWTNLPTADQASQGLSLGDAEQPSPTPLTLQKQALFTPTVSVVQSVLPPAIGRTGNKRSENIGKVNPANFYQPAPWIPASWPMNEETFQYNSYGELLPHLKYTPSQIMRYITDHSGNFANDGETYDGKSSGLTLWIQTTPADSSRRYPSPGSNTCRFAACPVLNKSITKGTFRVAFDEWSSMNLNPPVDPYHCAGYVHLYCLEKFTPFSYICANFNVRADTRTFPEGRNKMAITRDHEVFSKFVEKYIRIVSKSDFDHSREYEYKKTLCHKLVKTHLELEPKVRQRVREERGGNSLNKHLGDLMVYVAGELSKKAARDAKTLPKVVKTTTRKSKRKRDQDSSPDMDDMFSPSSKKARSISYALEAQD